jgi:hypothetical protein
MKTIYWRRTRWYPASNIDEVAVIPAERWTDEPLPPGTIDHFRENDWNRLDFEEEGDPEYLDATLNEVFGLCGETPDPWAIIDGLSIVGAIEAELGVRPSIPEDRVYACDWSPKGIIDGGSSSSEPSAGYEQFRSHCAMLYDQLRDALSERHGIDIPALADI